MARWKIGRPCADLSRRDVTLGGVPGRRSACGTPGFGCDPTFPASLRGRCRPGIIWIMPHPSAANDRVTVAGHFIAKAGALDEVLALWTELIEHVQAHEPGTELYLLEQNAANLSELWLHEAYQDEAAFVAHGHSPVVRGLAARIAPLIAERHLARTRKLVGIDRLPRHLDDMTKNEAAMAARVVPRRAGS